MERSVTPVALTIIIFLLVLIGLGIGIPFLFGAQTSGFEPAELSAAAAALPGLGALG